MIRLLIRYFRTSVKRKVEGEEKVLCRESRRKCTAGSCPSSSSFSSSSSSPHAVIWGGDKLYDDVKGQAKCLVTFLRDFVIQPATSAQRELGRSSCTCPGSEEVLVLRAAVDTVVSYVYLLNER